MDNHTYCMVFITAPNKETADNLALHLVEGKVAACVNIVADIKSVYFWQGELNEDNEVLMIVKTKSDLFHSHLVPLVKKHHPYDVPEIVALPILMGSSEYLEWIERNVSS